MKRCIIEDATARIVNVIEWRDDSDWSPPTGHSFAPQDDGEIGWVWNGIGWTRPPGPPDPPLVEVKSAKRRALREECNMEIGETRSLVEMVRTLAVGTILEKIALSDEIETARAKLASLLTQVQAATTVVEVNAINW